MRAEVKLIGQRKGPVGGARGTREVTERILSSVPWSQGWHTFTVRVSIVGS